MKRELYRRLQRGEVQVVGQYNDLVRKVKKDIMTAKMNYEVRIDKDAQKDPKGFYQLYKAKAKDRIGPLKGMDGRLIENYKEISKELNKYFLSVFSQEESERELEPVQIFRRQEVDKLSDIVINREVISREIDRFKKTKSPGPDVIFPRILKECREELVEPIAMIFRKSLDTGVIPSLWRQTCVVPIFKKGDKAESSNYCRISLTLMVDKMLEAIIARAIRKHLDEHQLIRHSQHGFSKGKSCLTNLLSFYRKFF